MRYLITGHTGFKGAWLSRSLADQGHDVFGFSLPPEPDALYQVADIRASMRGDVFADIRDASSIQDYIRKVSPEVVIHMAAQPLVRESYREPRYTLETNVMGTLNVLEAVRSASSVQAQIIVTTDKVYRNVNQVAGYLETDPLGGDDPYSVSKAMADLLVQSWTKSFDGPLTAIARAGNVIGGGDVSRDRLLPDVVESLKNGEAPRLRYPQAVRPWQHVLDCLNGYTTLAEAMLKNPSEFEAGSTWNFGPDISSFVSVGEVTTLASRMWGQEINWDQTPDPEFHEAGLLALDASKAQTQLNWNNILPFEAAIDWTVSWYRQVGLGAMLPGEAMASQLEAFSNLSSGSQLDSVGNGLS
jgi:CDP-glucose 4,6-dehydratase